jgi:hypothetical protein
VEVFDPASTREEVDSRINSLFSNFKRTDIDHHVEQLILLCYTPLATGMSSLISVATETGVVA